MSSAPSPHLQTGLLRLHAPAWLSAAQRAWTWLQRQRTLPVLRARSRRLQVQETLQLGEKRFVSILRVDGEQFLIGGSSSGVALLASLRPDADTQAFRAVLAAEERQACV